MSDALSRVRTRNAQTPQSEQADSRQVKNNAGGYTFEVSPEARILRFLTLGVDGGTYYQREAEYTKENADVVISFAKENGVELVDMIHEISTSGRAPRQNPTLFALACVFAFGDQSAKEDAKNVFNAVVRTGTHLFTFVQYTEQLRGWGRAVKNAVASWYLSKDVNDLSYQLVKYRQRADWTHRDVLRSAHPRTEDAEKNALLRWAVNGSGDSGTYYADGRSILPGWVMPYEAAKGFGQLPPANKRVYADIIREHPGMPWEALPDIALTYPETWEALLDAGMPLGALIRQLPKLTQMGILTGARLNGVTMALTNPALLKKARIHPVKVLYALRTYASGHSVKGSSSWTPITQVTDALDAAFYKSFGVIDPAGKRTLLALDVSGSMGCYASGGIITCAEGATAMAMATAASEPFTEVMGFAQDFRHLDISPRRRLDDNLATTARMNFGATDCSLPMKWARENNREIDTFAVYTDNETWCGRSHPHEALRDYRRATGIDAKLVVVAMTSTGFSIADPSDPGMLDVAGFDASVPAVISGFSRGDFG